MSTLLTADTFARLEEASRTLISPLTAPDVDAWRVEAVRTTRVLLEADHAMFAHSGRQRRYVSEVEGDPFAEGYDKFTATAMTEVFDSVDPVAELWLRHQRRRGYGVFSREEIEAYIRPHGYTLDDSLTAHEVMVANGLYDYSGIALATADGEVALQFANYRPGAAHTGEALRPLLRALLPSLRAGLDVLERFAAHDAALRSLDVVAEPVLVLDADGRERYRNAALVALLEADPERAAVEAALWGLGRDLRRLAFPRRFEAGPALAPMRREAMTTRGRYALSATLLPPGAFGPGEAALVTLAADVAPAALTAAEVQARHGLTLREAEVALLVAEGLTNAQIADRLFVATGTIKRHVENVLAKLGAPNRGAVAARLLQPGGTP